MALLCLLAGSMTTSVFMTNLAWVLLIVNWVAEWNWQQKFAGFGHNRSLQAILAVAAVYVLWCCGTASATEALYVLQIKLPMVAIPLVVLTTQPPSRRELTAVGVCHVGTVLVVSVIGAVRYATIPGLPYRDIVPYISHIRYGLNVCIAMVLAGYSILHSHRLWIKAAAAVSIVWLAFVLTLLHAYTAFIVLLVLAIVLPVAYGRRLHKAMRMALLTLGVAAWVLAIGSTLYYGHEYYTLRQPSTLPRPAATVNGNAYLHRQDGMIENGNYVHQYVCEKEMRDEWKKLSRYPFDSITTVGYSVYPALLRYLNALGCTKDSVGMQRLTHADVAAIEQGIANPVYLQRGPRKLFYVLFYEYENYRCFRSISNFSTLQRIELWRAGWALHKHKPLLGYGTGGLGTAIETQLTESKSPLAGCRLHLHNQYLTWLVAFGWVGLAVIVFFGVRAVVRGRLCRSALFTAHMTIVLVSFLADNTLSTLAGIVFVALGYSLLQPRTDN